MSTQDEDFLQALQAAYRTEAAEHLGALTSALLDLEKKPAAARSGLVEPICRQAHSLKGASRAVGRADIEGLCQSLESVLISWKKGDAAPSPDAFDAVHEALDVAGALAAGANAALDSRCVALRQRLNDLAVGGGAATAGPATAVPGKPEAIGERASAVAGSATEREAAMDTVRLPTARLERFLLKLEELLAVKSATRGYGRELADAVAVLERWQRAHVKVSPAVRALRSSDFGGGASARSAARSVTEFLDLQHGLVKSLEASLGAFHRSVVRDAHATDRLIDDLLGEAKGLLMMPCSTLLSLLPRLARDLCRSERKEAELTIDGAEIELDKRVLQELKDPLIHLVRNCIDHGIETPDVRRSRSKPEKGAVQVSVAPLEGQKVEIRVSDDGDGIDAEQVRQAAVRRKVVDGEAAARMTRQEAIGLVFKSDVSTKTAVTALSGRGLGLAIVQERVERLGGYVRLESESGRGTTFTLVVPLTLTTFRGLLVGAGGAQFVIPAAHVARVGRMRPSAIRKEGGRDMVEFDRHNMVLARLDRVLGLPRAEREKDREAWLPVVALTAGGKQAALVVDEVLTEEEVLVKPLTRPLVRVRNIAGITVLGTGMAAPVLNAGDLILSAGATRTTSGRTPSRSEANMGAGRRILVVEDSITSRMLLKGILESAGYRVKTAVDGAEGLACLRKEDFDLVVSDVDMPRLNGFDLTAGVRADPRIARLPVVLVTALSSPVDRERGMAVGASAYITKSSFDQSDLLNALRKLV